MQSIRHNRTILVASTLVLTAFAVFGLLVIDSSVSNCGGNTAALHVCKNFLLTLIVHGYESEEDGFDEVTINTLTSDLTSEELAALFESMSGSAQYSILNPDATISIDKRVPVIVCDVEFNNVPKPTIWNLFRRTTAYAVGYTDGSAELITPQQYQQLNRANFITSEQWIHQRSLQAPGDPP